MNDVVYENNNPDLWDRVGDAWLITAAPVRSGRLERK